MTGPKAAWEERIVGVLVDLGREREAAAISLTALAHHLRYQRSLARYAVALGVDTPPR